jgi:hypothetical protein
MDKIKINIEGIILKGDDFGMKIKIVDDSKNTGGYLILTYDNIEGFDNWVETYFELEEYFKDSNWVIKWS